MSPPSEGGDVSADSGGSMDFPDEQEAPQGQVPAAPDDVTVHAAESEPTEGRLHPAAMGVWGISHVGGALVLLVAGTIQWQVLAGLLLLGLGGIVVWWSRFRWKLEENAFVIERGLLQRRRRVIPFDRIQTVEVGRKLRHRAFGVVELHVEAVGGGKTEGRLDALDPDTARWLRARLLRLEAAGSRAELGEVVGEEPGTVLAHMSLRDLVLAGLTGGRVGVAAAILGFSQQALGERLQRVFERLPRLFGTEVLVALAVVTMLLIFLLSVVATALTYWDFTVRRDGANLRIRRGLLDQRLDTIPLRRIQTVRLDENMVRRLLGLATVKVVVAGRAGEGQARDTGTLLPLARRQEALRLIEAVLGRKGLATAQLQSMPTGARDRRLVRAVLTVAAVTAPLVVAFGWRGAYGLALLVPTAWLAVSAYRSLGHGAHGDAVMARSGVFIRRTAFVPDGSLQSLALTSTPFQRRRRLASLELQIARPPGGGDPTMIDLDADEAAATMVRLAGAAAGGGVRGGVAGSPQR